eukprot:6486385-Amphidinium_carterae.1
MELCLCEYGRGCSDGRLLVDTLGNVERCQVTQVMHTPCDPLKSSEKSCRSRSICKHAKESHIQDFCI